MRSIIFAFLLLIPSLVLTGQESAGLDPLEVAAIQSVSGVTLSEDGSLLAFTRSVPADPMKENKPASSHLFIYNVATGQTMPFYTRGSVRDVAFRPNHASITFLAKMEGDKGTSLYEMPLTGGEATRLFAFETSISAYQWAPDGKRLAFRAAEPKADGRSDLPYEPIIYEENLTYIRAYLVGIGDETGGPSQLMLDGSVSDLAWSPAGDRLAVMAAPTPLVDDSYMAQTLYILDASTRKKTGEVDHAGKKGPFAWSPDGSRLALIAGADIHDPTPGRLFVVSGDGAEPKNVAPNLPGAFDHFEWVDNERLQVLTSEGVRSFLGDLQVSNGKIKRRELKGDLNISSFDRSADGALALVADSPQHPQEAFWLKPDQPSEPVRITDSNPWLAREAMGRQEVVRYEARDGLEIEGLLIYPVDYEEGKKYPLITVVHGGPESHYNHGWLTAYSMPGQMAAAEGYAVFYPNYRGSTGRGVEFAMSSQADLAGKEFDDIVDGVDYLIEQGLVDKDKVGVTGGSYGGYATGWMATRYTDRFAAGVMFVGISDNISKWGTSDIPEELYLVHSRKRIWEDYEWFLKRSPIYYADQARTPLLIMAGAEDTRVDPSQSMELYRHIKTRTDTPVRLVLYPGEGHGNRNATARLDYSRRLMGWFGKYLKGEEPRP